MSRAAARARITAVMPRLASALAARQRAGHDPAELVGLVDAPNALARVQPGARPLVLVVPRDAACALAWLPAWLRVELARLPPRGALDVVVRGADGTATHVPIPIPR